MKILADENIPGLEALFGSLGQLSAMPGRAIRSADLDGTDILLVRSVTRVDQGLLQGCAVSFVGSCTTGIDHVDLDWLRRAGIGFGHAPGANARSVVEYVLSVLCWLSRQEDIQDKTVGVVGLGHVGNRLCLLLSKLGLRCIAYDPWVRTTAVVEQVAHLEPVLDADIVTLHVPLIRGGLHPTWHLFDAARLDRLRDDAVLINSSRGSVVDQEALASALTARPSLRVVLDVWEGEPAIDTGVMQKVALATPHIAGYSYDGKYRGSEMVCEALRAHLGQPATKVNQQPVHRPMLLPHGGPDADLDWPFLCRLMTSIYDVTVDDRRMRVAMQHGVSVAAVFEGLRRNYPVRREASAYRLGDDARNPLDLLFDWVERRHRR